MLISRFATLALVCLLASACTVVVQPAADQPRPAPSANDQGADVATADPEPVRRPPVQVPRRRPSNTDSNPRNDEPDSPSRRPSERSNRLNLGIPPGHLPRPGECRVWVQGLPPGQQARARSCTGILATAPAGSWILYRPARYQRQVRVRYLHDVRQTVIAVRAFDAETGAYLRDFALEEDDNNMGPVADGARRPPDRPRDDENGNRGNSGNPPGRMGPVGDRGTREANIGGAVGRGGSSRDTLSGDVSRGNQGGSNRSGNVGDNDRNQGRRKPVTAEDSTGRGRAADNNRGIADDRSNSPGARRRDADGVEDAEGSVGGDSSSTERETIGIPARYLPDAGQCRVWIPGLAYGRQAEPASCDGITDEVPAGAWILRRSSARPDVIQVDYVDEENAGVIVRTGTFDADTGVALRSTQ